MQLAIPQSARFARRAPGGGATIACGFVGGLLVDCRNGGYGCGCDDWERGPGMFCLLSLASNPPSNRTNAKQKSRCKSSPCKKEKCTKKTKLATRSTSSARTMHPTRIKVVQMQDK
jgi:hypothetical protein